MITKLFNLLKLSLGVSLISCLPLAAQQTPSQNLQAISQSGLLPVYGVDLRLDPTWVDSSSFPSQSAKFPNSGTSSALQKVWSALQPGGYSILLVTLDVRDSAGAANRAGNLCAWANANNVRLILSLTAADAGQPIGDNFPKQSSDFVNALVGLMRANNGQYLANYAQIMAYQLGDELNHPGKHGGMGESAAQQLALAAAKSLRSTERNALDGSGISATPIMASASFDFDLISAGAIAGGTMSDANYNQAYQSLEKFLSGLAASADIDVLVVDWFAGSVGGGGVEKAPDLLKSLLTDVPGKQFVLGTGFSTAFRSADEQKRLFTTAFANLSDFRASAGSDSPFIGTIFREALSGSNPNPAPPRATLPGEMDKWDWTARAAELTAMWTKKKKSADMSWWLTRVENNMGLVTLQSDASGNVVAANALPAQQGMSQIAGAVGAVSSQMAAAPVADPNSSSFVQAGATPSNLQYDPYGSASGQAQQQPQQAGQQGVGTDPYGAVPSNSFSQPQPTATNPYGGAPANPSGQAGCTTSIQGQQQFNDPYAQQSYGQQIPATCSSPGMSPNMGTVQTLHGFAQQALTGLLNGVLQRLTGVAAGTGGSGFGSNINYPDTSSSSFANSGSPYSYYGAAAGSTQPSSQLTSSSALYQPSGTGPLTVQIGPQDVSIQPMSPQVGTSATINVNLHNLGSADAYGLVVQAAGSDGATLAQQASVHVAPNSAFPLQLQWSPSAAASSYGITISVSDGSGNQLTSAQMGPLTVTTAPIVNAGSGGASSGTAGTATTSGPSNISTPAGGAAGSTGTSPINKNPLGSVKLTAIQVGIPGQPIVAGQASSVVVPLLNPYLVPLGNITATLLVDGQNLQTQTMSILLPQQSHSAIFQGVSFAPSGQHQISVNVISQRSGSDPLTSTTTRQVSVVDASSATASTAGKTSSSTASGQSGTTTASSTGPPSSTMSAAGNATAGTASGSVRSVLPQTFQIGRTVLPSRPGPLPSAVLTAASAGSGSRPVAAPTTTAAAAPVPSTGTPGVRSITSLPPRPGSPGIPLASSSGAAVRPVATGATTATNLPTRPGPADASAAPGPTSAAAPVKSVTPGTAAPAPQAVGSILSRPGPGGASAAPGPTSGAAPVRTMTPGTAAPAPQAVGGIPARPGPGGQGMTATPQANPNSATGGISSATAPGNLELSVSAPDIHFSPASYNAGQNATSTSFTTMIHNLGTSGTQSATVVFTLMANGRQVASQQLPFSIAGRGTFQASWTYPTPIGPQMQLVVSVLPSGAPNPATNQASILFKLPPK